MMDERRDDKPTDDAVVVVEAAVISEAEMHMWLEIATAAKRFVQRCEEISEGMKDVRWSDDPGARLDFITGGVAGALEFLRAVAPKSDARIPFLALLTELQSIEGGRGSRILSVPKTMKGPAPSRALLELQTLAIASIDALRTGETKMKLAEAARVVAKCIDKAEVKLPGDAPTRQQLLQWRTQIFSRPSGSTEQRDQCRAITKWMLTLPADGGLKAGIIRTLESHLTTIFSAAHTGKPE